MQLIIDTANTEMSVRNKCFMIKNETQQKIISPYRVDSIAITSNVSLNYSVIALAATHNIPIYFYNKFGKLIAQSQNETALNNGLSRVSQYQFTDSTFALEFLKKLLITKGNMQKSLIKKRLKPIKEFDEYSVKYEMLLKKLIDIKASNISEVRSTVFGIEGNLSKLYFQTLKKTLPEKFQFDKRSRRPSLDMFNAALNYLYGCAYSVIHQGILAAKLDPYVGLLHVNGVNKSSLTYDLIEPIRPIIDRLLLQLIDEEKLNESHFKNNAKAVWIHKKGKKVILTAFHNYLYQKIKVDEQVFTVKTHCFLLAEKLKKEIKTYVSNHV